jgi:effector-binding domain-containing protein
MQTVTVQTKSQPMLYVTRKSTMAPDEIGKAMADAFATLGKFIGQHGVPVVGPPLAIYHDYSKSGLVMDIGFPVMAPATGMAAGEIRAGETPSGKALKAVHRGAYDKLRETYDALGEQMKQAGIPMPAKSWEVYLTDPDTTPEAEQITEIFMPVK